MSMSKTDVLIEAIQSKVTDEQVTSWVSELGDILDEQDKLIQECFGLIQECYKFILDNVGLIDPPLLKKLKDLDKTTER